MAWFGSGQRSDAEAQPNREEATEVAPTKATPAPIQTDPISHQNDSADQDSKNLWQDPQCKAESALDCSCMAGLREGPCGKEFSEAFVCFIESTAEYKGSDCVESFLNLQSCLLDYPDAYSRHKSEDTSEEQEKESTSSEN